MMRKFFPLILLALTFVACAGDASKHKPQPAEPYTVYGTLVDPATNSLIMTIKLDPPFTEDRAKKAAEMVIEQYKARFSTITVQTYTNGTMPYAVSVFNGTQVTHQVNAQLAPQKIPSH